TCSTMRGDSSSPKLGTPSLRHQCSLILMPRRPCAYSNIQKSTHSASVTEESAISHTVTDLDDYSTIYRESFREWCGREDSNFHGLPHSDLNAARLPIPPRPHGAWLRAGPRWACSKSTPARQAAIAQIRAGLRAPPLAPQNEETAADDDGGAEDRDAVRHLAPEQPAEPGRPQDRQILQRRDHRGRRQAKG